MATKTAPAQKKARDGSTMPKNVAQDEKTAQRNLEIIELHKTGEWRQVDLAKKFKMSQGRVSQIIRNPNSVDYYVYE